MVSKCIFMCVDNKQVNHLNFTCEICMVQNFSLKYGGKRPPRKSRHGWEYNIKIEL
jgi:hypothetical protein